MRLSLIILIGLLLARAVHGQDSPSKNFAGLQFGGHALVGISYDRVIMSKNNIKLSGSTGAVINEYADDTDPNDRPIYGLNFGLTGLVDLNIKAISLECGLYSSPYFYKSLTFINYYSCLGLRIYSKDSHGPYLSLCWVPSLHYSKPLPDAYNAIDIALKIGIAF